jgi:hypothetical protein
MHCSYRALLLHLIHSMTHTHTHLVGLFWLAIGPSQRPLPDTIHSQETDIHTPGGIQTLNPNKQAAANVPLRESGHRDRL